MEKFVRLTKTNDKGITQETERWNTRYIAKYRKWVVRAGEKDESKTLVHIDHPSVAKGTMVVDNSVEDIDKQINEQ
jgi:hypothetical protein